MGVERLKALVDLVIQGEVDMNDSFGVERDAKAGFFFRLIEAVRPALPAIVSKVPSKGSGGYGRVEQPSDHYPWRGVLVGGDPRPVPKKNGSPGGYEALGGHALYLSEEGAFVMLEYRGAVVRGGGYSWEAISVALSHEDVAIQRRFPIGEIVAKLAAELEVQSDSKSRSADRSFDIAKKVREAASILEGVR